MPGVAMAPLAQIGLPVLEQIVSNGSVGAVTDPTILSHRLVVMQERSPFLHVAGIAGLVGAGLDQLHRVVAVHVVAIRTGHLSLQYRMV